MAKAKSKAKGPADAKKRFKKLLTAVRKPAEERPPEAELVGELTALLDEDAEVMAEVDKARLVRISAQEGLLGLFEALLERGADLSATADDRQFSPLGALAEASGDDARVISLLERAVARGYSLDDDGQREGPLTRVIYSPLARIEALLRLGVGHDSVLAALGAALGRLDRAPALLAAAERLLAHVDSVDRPGSAGLSALHVVALRGPLAVLDATLARSADPAHVTTAASHFSCDACSPPGGGIVPSVFLPAGLTARDLVVEVHSMYAAASVWYGEDGFDGKRRPALRDALAARAARLAERGLPHGTPGREATPTFVAEVDALFARLAAHVGGDAAALQRRAATIPLEGVGPWTYASSLLERSGPLLMRGAVEAMRGESWLAHLIAGDHRRFVAARAKELGHRDLDVSKYPSEAERPLKKGQVVGGRGETLLIVWPHAEGIARIAAVSPEKFELLGTDVFDFLRRELTALGVAVDDVPASGGAGPRGRGINRVLKADYDAEPGPKDISRVGGLPIGIDDASWPRHDDAPMHHVLTIDLAEHPTFQPAGVRALALFISHPMDHEAYTPSSEHARVVLLTDADLEKGVPEAPEGLDADAVLAAGTLRFESAATLTDEELFRHSFAGLMPIWLQGDDTESFAEDDEDDDEYAGEDDDDGDEDGDEDEDDRPGAPVHFVLQFDESLVPGINLGDAGVMYVFAETAWFQCH